MLGSSIGRYIRIQNYELLAPSRAELDLHDQKSIEEFLKVNSPDYIIHCAATVGGIKSNIKNPTKYILNNILIDSHLVGSSLKLGVENFLYMSSSCVYPRHASQPMQVESLLTGELEPTNKSYALAKLSGMQLIESVSKEYNLNYRSLILSNLYGPNDNFSIESSHLIAACIRRLHEAKISNAQSIKIIGTGGARREFTYVEDVASWIATNVNKISEFPNEMNLGFGKDYSVNEYFRIAAEIIGYKGKFIHDLKGPEGMAQKLMDSSIARSRFDWNPLTTPIVGIAKSYQYWLSEGETIGI